jgi:glycerophosphoryl diester phosphodiesterase
MIEELITRVFSTRNCAHLTHWKTDSYSEHIALGDFYNEIIETLDKYVEVYQGNFDIIGKVKLNDYSGDVLDCITEDVKWIDKNYENLCHHITSLSNIIDELVGIYLRTLYKLKQLH